MKTYSATYKFEENEISYEAKVNGQVFETANEEINFNHVSDLKKGFANQIINAVIWAISDEQNGMFVNDKPVMMIETQLMQSNANEAYSVLIDGDLFPISMHVTIEVTSNPFELLK
jgi:hypothetical protein